jgi:hypothetical protein
VNQPLAGRWGQPDPSALEKLLTGARSGIPVPPSTDRAAWAGVDPGAAAAILAEASADRIQAWPQPKLSQYARFWRDGVRTAYEAPAAELRRRTSVAVVAAAVTDAEEWLDEAADGLLMLCEQTSWCWPAHEGFASARGHVLPDLADPYLDLGAGETVAVLAWADLVLAERLDARVPGLRQRMRAEALARVITPFLQKRDWHWLGLHGRPGNWTPWVHGNVLAAALFLVDHPPLQARVVALVIEGLDRYAAAVPSDGGCDEGYTYWWHGPARLAEALELLEWATDGALSTAGLLEESARFPHRMALGDGWYVNVADGPARPSYPLPWHLLHRWGARIGDPEVMAQAASHRDSAVVTVAAGLGRALVGLFDSGWASASARTTSMPLPTGSWLPDVQVLVAREQAGSAAGLALAAKGGHNAEHHNHNDVGSYIVACDGAPVLIDLGQPTYTSESFTDRRYEIWTMQSQWHNLPVINGHDQAAGPDFAAAEVSGQLTPDHAELRLDISGAYPAEARCLSWQRRVRLDRSPVRITISDAWRLTAPGEAAVQHVVAGEVLDHRPGELRVRSLSGGEVALRWRPGLGTGRLERHEIDDPLLGEVWGDAVHRLGIPLPRGTSGHFVLTVTAEDPAH